MFTLYDALIEQYPSLVSNINGIRAYHIQYNELVESGADIAVRVDVLRGMLDDLQITIRIISGPGLNYTFTDMYPHLASAIDASPTG